MTLDAPNTKPVLENAPPNSTDVLPGKSTANTYRQVFNSQDGNTAQPFLNNFQLVDNSDEHLPRSVNSTGDGKYRVYRSGSDFTVLDKRGGFYYGKDETTDRTVLGPLKVHVAVNSPEDLKKVQSVLIPALQNDPELQQLVPIWKTMDPQYGIDGNGDGVAPTGIGQGAKGFTIYTRSAEDAAKVQQRVDEILAKNGLSLDAPIASGNVDQVYGTSNRVGITRDHWFSAISEDGHVGAVLEPQVEQSIKRTLGTDPQQRLTPDELRRAEQYSGIKENSLEYTKDGRLLYTQLGLSRDKEGVYVTELGASNLPGDRSGRKGIYSLYRTFGNDPSGAAIEDSRNSHVDINGVSVNVDGEGFDVGRNDVDRSKDGRRAVSSTHAHIFRGPDGNFYINDKSANGTWVNGNKIEPGQDVPFTPNDQINLGAPDGPALFSKLPDDIQFRRPIGNAIVDPIQPRIITDIVDPIQKPIGPSIIADPIPKPIIRDIVDPIQEPIGPNIIADPIVRPIPGNIIASGGGKPVIGRPSPILLPGQPGFVLPPLTITGG